MAIRKNDEAQVKDIKSVLDMCVKHNLSFTAEGIDMIQYDGLKIKDLSLCNLLSIFMSGRDSVHNSMGLGFRIVKPYDYRVKIGNQSIATIDPVDVNFDKFIPIVIKELRDKASQLEGDPNTRKELLEDAMKCNVIMVKKYIAPERFGEFKADAKELVEKNGIYALGTVITLIRNAHTDVYISKFDFYPAIFKGTKPEKSVDSEISGDSESTERSVKAEVIEILESPKMPKLVNRYEYRPQVAKMLFKYISQSQLRYMYDVAVSKCPFRKSSFEHGAFRQSINSLYEEVAGQRAPNQQEYDDLLPDNNDDYYLF